MGSVRATDVVGVAALLTLLLASSSCRVEGAAILTHLAPEAFPQLSDVTCGGGVAKCPTNNTCCKLSSDGYGCCPYLDGVCCKDGAHCCPANHTCNPSNGQCISSLATVFAMPAWTSLASAKSPVPARARTGNASSLGDICPDHRSECSPEHTCCLTTDGSYGCCPFFDAQCCDNNHCCPEGNECAPDGTCVNTLTGVRSPASNIMTSLANVVCPDKSQCAESTTCCSAPNGGYGCCPLQDANCCADQMHCCPQGTVCNATAGGCTRATLDEALPWTLVGAGPAPAAAAWTLLPQERTQACSAEGTACPMNTTCCKLEYGAQACCPLPNATCCGDVEGHCCPGDRECDLTSMTCLSRNNVSNTLLALRAPMADLAAVPASPTLRGLATDEILCRLLDVNFVCPASAQCCADPRETLLRGTSADAALRAACCDSQGVAIADPWFM